MLDLSLGQAIAVSFGCVLAATGLAGLIPVLLRWRAQVALPRLRVNEDLYLALASAEAFVRPSPPRFEAVAADSKAASATSASQATALEAEELKAQLFAIRMTLSDLTAEVQSLRGSLCDFADDEGASLFSQLREAA
jgi:hypothetical protein